MCVTAFDVRSQSELLLGTKKVMKGLCRSTSVHLLLDRRLISFVILSSYSFISSRGGDFNVLCTCSKCRHCQYLTAWHAVRHLETEITAERSCSDVQHPASLRACPSSPWQMLPPCSCALSCTQGISEVGMGTNLNL